MRYTISPDAAFAAVEDGAVVLHMGTKRYYSLNETGTFVWRRLEDGISRAEIVAHVVEEYDVGIAEAEMAVARLLDELVQESLIQAPAPA
ncbi:MAG TPA: PqqD family protein [Gemmatimonadaceae bacterium]|nr:PqqD family protein [Gemmatimonadaceae bacterium]